MARVINNPLVEGTSGSIGKSVVYKNTKRGTIAAKHPDTSHIIPSKNQTKRRAHFAMAVAYARSVMQDPQKSAAYESGKHYSVYHGAIGDYMRSVNPGKANISELPPAVQSSLQTLSLNESQLRAVAYISREAKITNGIYQEMNKVSKATASRHLRELADLDIIRFNGGKGAGAHYIIGSKTIGE